MTGCPNPGWRRYCLWNGGFWRFWCDVWVEWRRLESSLSEEVTLSGIVGVQVVGDVRTFRVCSTFFANYADYTPMPALRVFSSTSPTSNK
ncbi:hypothetical protein AMTR_s00079p00144530 [Amborella trichopoda]|uniref:Uncharacterized protein n=1 Tax=Amborella trichopoda TaxID=13333 RepID=W1P8I3_AMBTC|nr:hypothetical protein AMTR_s00079p00144530 [Amborella trichopoda]